MDKVQVLIDVIKDDVNKLWDLGEYVTLEDYSDICDKLDHLSEVVAQEVNQVEKKPCAKREFTFPVPGYQIVRK